MAEAPTIFDGPGTSREHGRAVTWSATPLGAVATWDPALRAVVRLVLDMPTAAALWIGPAFTLVHNDGYLAVLGSGRLPAMGRAGPEIWGRNWDVYEGEILRVRAEGAAVRKDEVAVHLERDGHAEDAWFGYTFSPVRDDAGRILGVLNSVEELTQLVRARTERDERLAEEAALRASEARHTFLLGLSDTLRSLGDVDAIPAAASRMLAGHVGADRAFFAVVDEPGARIEVLPDHARPGLASLRGKLPFAEVTAEVAALRPGRSLVVPDVGASTALSASARHVAAALGIGAVVVAPLVRKGEVVATMNVAFTAPRALAPTLETLVHEVGERTWNAIERARAEAATSLANEQLLEADRRKNEFLGMLSHELRNPLSPMKNGLYLLEHAAPGSPQAERALAVVQRQLLQLERLVDDLLDVTRITQNKIQLQRESVELAALVRGTFEDYRSAFEAAGLAAAYTGPAEDVFVVGDRNRLAQVVGNLLQNAVKFSSRGGGVRVELARVGETAEIRVADTGVGLTAEIASRLFEPFVQADRTLDRSRGGLGLGLALVKGLVEQHGGSVEARSEGPGRGAEFVVRLPVCAPVRPPRHLPVSPRPAPRHVLVIEDNADAADSLRDLLELEGHAVDVARTGPDGLALARAHVPDVVLCDIGLPGMNGYEVARAFRADPSLAGVPLVAVSGYARPEDLAQAADAGFARHMAKPPSLEKIERVLALLTG